MSHIRRFWPVYLAMFVLLATVYLSIRSWQTYDVVVLNRGPDKFPSMTFFTVHSCLRGKISTGLHSFSFDSQPVSTASGYHSLPVLERNAQDFWMGDFHFKSHLNIPSYNKDEVFAGVPIWLAFCPGYAPLLLWLWNRREAQRN